VRIQVNGEPRELPDGTTVVLLLERLGVTSGPVAVERNTEIVPRAEHASTVLHEGDEVEVVQFVGGG
jgi:sulfur carrier protein